MKLRVLEDVLADVQAAGRRIDRETKTKGWRKLVLAEFRAACRMIAASPTMFVLVEEGGVPPDRFREYYIARFRYRVIYEIGPLGVTVVDFVHAARRPGGWHE